MNFKKLFTGVLVSFLLVVGSVAAFNYVSAPASGTTLNLEMGNNNGTDTVYDTSGNGANATETGTVTFSNTGVDFPGTANNYLTSTGTGVFNTANCAFVYKFTPTFTLNDNAYHALSDGADSGTRYGLLKTNTNTIAILLGGTAITQIPYATYSPYWKTNEENIFIYSGTTGNNNVWLNGVQLLTGEATAWTPSNPATIYIGATFVGSSNFDGKMHYFRVWPRLLTADEISNLSADRVNNVRGSPSDTTINLDFGNNDGTSVVYDTSGNGLNSTTVNAPTLVEGTNGYVDLNGSNQYSDSTGTGVFNTTSTCTVTKFAPDTAVADNTIDYLYDSELTKRYYAVKANNASNNVLSIGMGNTEVGSIAQTTYEDYWNVGDENVLIVSGTTGNTSAWLNGNLILNASATAWTPDDPATFRVGQVIGGTGYFDGKIYYTKIYPRLCTADEVTNFSANAKNKSTAPSSTGLKLNLQYGNSDGSTTVYDTSGNGHNFTAVNSPTLVEGSDGYVSNNNTANKYLINTDTTIFGDAAQSVYVKFRPDFSPTDNDIYVLYDSLAPRHSIDKLSNTFGNVIRIYAGNTLLKDIPQVDYEDYWKIGEENILIATYTSSANTLNVWLNGTKIVTNDCNAHTPAAEGDLFTSGSTGQGWDGRIYDWKVYNRILPQSEIDNIFLAN